MFDIKDKIVLITGGASGIGASVVRKLLEEDIKHVAILDVDDKNGFSIENEVNTKYGSNRVKFIKCDVTQEQELLNAFSSVKSEQGYIDVVINNAGIANDITFAREIDINLTALVRSSLRAWDLMRKDVDGKGGTIINVASVAAISQFTGIPVYSATKAAVVKFSTTLGNEESYSRTGIRVLAVCFGTTDTPLAHQQIIPFDPIMEESITAVKKAYNWLTPEEAAQGLLEMYKLGKSGSLWLVMYGTPTVDITDTYTPTFKV